MANPSALARDLRAGVADLSAQAADELSPLWTAADSPEVLREALFEVAPAVVEAHTAAAAVLAAAWYDEQRAAVGATGWFAAEPADLGDAGARSLVGWAMSAASGPVPDLRRSRVLLEGGIQSRIANASRQTVMAAATQDRAARGWQRVGDGSSCAFCQMLIGRGAVYGAQATATFGAHDHCGCAAIPAWSGEPVPVKPYTPTARHVSDADRARVREWINGSDI